MTELVRFLQAHGTEAAVEDGQLIALARFTYRHPVSGDYVAGAVWEPIEATSAAVLAWLGY